MKRDLVFAALWGVPAGVAGGWWWAGRDRRARARAHARAMTAERDAAVLAWTRSPRPIERTRP